MGGTTQKAPRELQIVVPLNEDGSKRRGARYKPGENFKTGSSQTRESQELLVQWLVTPKQARDPSTKTALAAELGVTTRTLNLWEKTPFVMRRVSQETKNQAKVQNASTVLEALYVTATNSESARQVSAAKVYLDYIDGAVDEVSAEELAEMSPAELADLLYDTLELVNDQVEEE